MLLEWPHFYFFKIFQNFRPFAKMLPERQHFAFQNFHALAELLSEWQQNWF